MLRGRRYVAVEGSRDLRHQVPRSAAGHSPMKTGVNALMLSRRLRRDGSAWSGRGEHALARDDSQAPVLN
jgi:hypothetical protein